MGHRLLAPTDQVAYKNSFHTRFWNSHAINSRQAHNKAIKVLKGHNRWPPQVQRALNCSVTPNTKSANTLSQIRCSWKNVSHTNYQRKFISAMASYYCRCSLFQETCGWQSGTQFSIKKKFVWYNILGGQTVLLLQCDDFRIITILRKK
jgi:hypothetical protein